MSTADHLRRVALDHFSTRGFTATSLSAISAEVGIRKSSIYAHFKSKDDLYLQIVDQVISEEIAGARAALLNDAPLEARLDAYLASIRVRYQGTANMRFWLRAFYLPPEHLMDTVLPALHAFMDSMEAIMTETFVGEAPRYAPPHTLGVAFLAIVDSLQAELLWGGLEKFERRRQALWLMFSTALRAP